MNKLGLLRRIAAWMTLEPGLARAPVWRIVFRIVLGLELVALGWLASSGGALQQRILEGDDKLQHALAFVVVSFTMMLLWRPAVRLIVLLLAVAVLVEVVQLFLPNRSASVADLAASFTGLAFGAAVSFLIAVCRGILATSP